MTPVYDVVALGELLVDFTENSVSARGNPLFEANPGGAPCNVLSMLCRLGRGTPSAGACWTMCSPTAWISPAPSGMRCSVLPTRRPILSPRKRGHPVHAEPGRGGGDPPREPVIIPSVPESKRSRDALFRFRSGSPGCRRGSPVPPAWRDGR